MPKPRERDPLNPELLRTQEGRRLYATLGGPHELEDFELKKVRLDCLEASNGMLRAAQIRGVDMSDGDQKLFDDLLAVATEAQHRVDGRKSSGRKIPPMDERAEPEQEFTRNGWVNRRKPGELRFGDWLRSLATGPRNEAEKRALSESVTEDGGYTVPDALFGQFIDALRPRMVLAAAGAVVVPVTTKETNVARVDADLVPQWRDEGDPMDETQPTIGRVKVLPKSLGALCRVSIELLDDSENIQQILERQFSAAFAREFDRVGLIGSGISPEPLGLRGQAGLSTEAFTIASYNPVLDGLLELELANANAPTALILSPRNDRAFAGLSGMTDGQPLQRPPKIRDLPFLTTSTMPDGVMFLGDFKDLWIGVRQRLVVRVLRERYLADSGEIGFVGMARMDVVATRPASFCAIGDGS